MPSSSIATGTPSTLALNNTCPHVNNIVGMPSTAVDPPHIGLFVSVKVTPASTGLVASGFTRKLTYGASNIPMQSVAVIDAAGSPTNGWIEVFYLQDIVSGNGAASVVNYTNRNLADTANAAVKSIEMDSGTYSRVDQITPGSIQLLSFAGGAANIFVTSAKSKRVVGFFGCSVAITGASAGTEKIRNNLGSGIGNTANSSIVDAPGDNAVQLTANNGSTGNWGAIAFSIDFIMAANADQQSTMDIVQSALTGSPNTSAVSAQELQDAVLGQAANIVSHSAGLSDIKTPATNIGLVSFAINFGQYPDGALPSAFTIMEDHTGSPTGGIQILNGKAQMVVTGTAPVEVDNTVLYNAQETKTDFQMVSAVLTNNENTGISTQLLSRWNGLELSDSGYVATVLDLTPSSTENYSAHINAVFSGITTTIWTGTLPIVPGALYSLVSGALVFGQIRLNYFQILINLVPQPIGVSGANYVIDTLGASKYGSGFRKTGFFCRYIKYSDIVIPGYPTVSSYPISYWAMQDQVFPMDVTSNINGTVTQLDTFLTTPQEYLAERILEIGANYALEIGPLTSLEIDMPVTDVWPGTLDGSTIRRLSNPVKAQQRYGPIYDFVDPTIQPWVPVNQGAATFGPDHGDMLLTVPNDTQVHACVVTPLGPNSISEFYLEVGLAGLSANLGGIICRNSSSGVFTTFGPEVNGAVLNYAIFMQVYSWSGFNTTTGLNAWQAVPFLLDGVTPKWLRIRDDGTSIFYEISINRLDWNIFTSHTRAAFTPDQIGLFGYMNSAAGQGMPAPVGLPVRCKSFQMYSV